MNSSTSHLTSDRPALCSKVWRLEQRAATMDVIDSPSSPLLVSQSGIFQSVLGRLQQECSVCKQEEGKGKENHDLQMSEMQRSYMHCPML